MFKSVYKKLLLTIVVVAMLTTIATKVHAEKSSIISDRSEILTVVNLLTPEIGQQDEVIKLLKQGMTETMQFQPGFISANIHKSKDSEHVLVYAQWQSSEHLQAAVKLIQNNKAPNMAKVFVIAQPDYHPYDVVSVHRPNIE